MDLDDLMNADIRSTLLRLRAQGYGFMLRGASRHWGLRLFSPLPRMATWQDFAACAARRLDVFVPGGQAIALPTQAGATLQPESMLIVRLMQTIRRDEDLRTIEATLKHDAALTYRLLLHINSPGVGIGVQVQSLRHAVAMFGYSPQFRWLSVLLATSNKDSAAFMTKKAIVRGRFVELMGQGIAPLDDRAGVMMSARNVRMRTYGLRRADSLSSDHGTMAVVESRRGGARHRLSTAQSPALRAFRGRTHRRMTQVMQWNSRSTRMKMTESNPSSMVMFDVGRLLSESVQGESWRDLVR